MIIDGKDLARLKKYLLASLETISDADNEALSEYIIALVRNEKPMEQLKKECLEQLEEFLESHNSDFVVKLFEWLEKMVEGSPDQGVNQTPTDNDDQKDFERDPKKLKPVNDSGLSKESKTQTFPIESINTRFSGPRSNNSHSQYSRQNLQRCPDYEERGYCVKAEDCPYPHGEDAIRMDNIELFNRKVRDQSFNGSTGQPHNAPQDDYDPSEPYLGGQRGGSRPSNPARGHRAGFQRGRFGTDSHHSGYKSGPLKGYTISRNTLVLDNVPADKLNEASIKEYFERFGEIAQVVLDKYTNKAEVEFKTEEDALKANNSPDPIFDNRFVKLFWKRVPNSGAPRPTPHQASETKLTSFTKPEDVNEKARKQLVLCMKRTELLEKQVEAQKKLLAQLENKNLPAESRKSVMDLLKNLSDSIKEGMDSISKYKLTRGSSASASKSQPAEAMEVDPPTKLSPPIKPVFRGGFSSNKWASKAAVRTYHIDNRPKAFKVFGFAPEKRELVEVHLKGIRGVNSTKVDNDSAGFIVECKNAYLAKRAQIEATKLGDMTFQSSWIALSPPEATAQPAAASANQ